MLQRITTLTLGLFIGQSLALDYANSTASLASCSYSATCSTGGYEGVCVSISAGCCSGTTTSNLCPGSSDVKCCTKNPCSTPSGSGSCMSTSQCSSSGGKSYSGYCTGPSDLQCCVKGSSTGHYGVDVSSTITTSAASCFKSAGLSFVIPRGYKSTGAVDTNVCTSIKNAAAAGIATRDAYMFPCEHTHIPLHWSAFTLFLSLRPHLLVQERRHPGERAGLAPELELRVAVVWPHLAGHRGLPVLVLEHLHQQVVVPGTSGTCTDIY